MILEGLTILHHRAARTCKQHYTVQPKHLEMQVKHDILHGEGKEGDILIYDTRILLKNKYIDALKINRNQL